MQTWIITEKYKLIAPKALCGDGEEVPPAPKPDDAPPPPPKQIKDDDIDLENLPPDVTLTQEQLNKAMGKLRQKYRSKNEELLNQVNTLTQEMNMTKEERERLNKVLEQSRSNYQSELERARESASKLQEELNNTKQGAEKELNAWRRRFESTLIDREVSRACSEANVFSPEQMRDLLDRHLVATQVVDDKGNQTENFLVAVKTTDDEGNVINMPVLDYIKKMDESGKHPNLFKHNMKPGLNTSTGATGGDDSIPTDTKELSEWLSKPENRAKFLSRPANK